MGEKKRKLRYIRYLTLALYQISSFVSDRNMTLLLQDLPEFLMIAFVRLALFCAFVRPGFGSWRLWEPGR